MKSLEQVVSEQKAEIATLTQKLQESESRHATRDKNDAKAALTVQLKEAGLSEASTKAINEMFEKGVLTTPELVKSTIESFKGAAPAAKVVRNNGAVNEVVQEAFSDADVKHTARSMNISETEARKILGLK